MNLNMSKFKKLAEDKKSATFQHPDGHKITVAKHVLTPGMRGQLEKMPLHLAEGTPEAPISSEDHSDQDAADQNSSQNSSQMPQAAAPTTVINIGQPAAPQPNASMPAAGAPVDPRSLGVHQESQMPQFPAPHPIEQPQNAAPESIPPAAPQVAPQADVAKPVINDPYGTKATMNAYGQGLNQQTSGIQNEAAAQGALGQSQAKQLDANIQTQQQQAQDFQSHVNELNQERAHFTSDIQNQHIDPKHYLNSMGTGQKIATAIGLILGGIGSGFTHQGNVAMEFLNKQISNDVESQKVDIGKSENLLSANLRQYGNMRDAMDMTRVQQMDIVKNQLAETAAKAQSPMAQANAQKAIGALDMQAAPIIGQMAMRKTFLSSAQGAAQEGQGQSPLSHMDPAQAAKVAGMVGLFTPEQSSAAEKEAAILTARKKALAMVDNVMKQQDELQSVGSRVGSPLQSTSRLATLGADLVPLVLDSAPSKRLTPESVQQEISPWAIKLTDNKNTRKWKLGQFKQYIMNQSDDTPNLRSIGIGDPAISKIPEYAPVK